MINYSQVAFNIINNFLKIYKDMVISISGEIHNAQGSVQPLVEIPLIEELAIAIRKRKAFPVLELSTQNLKKRFFQEMPDEILEIPPHYYDSWIDAIDVFIEINWKNLTDEFDEKIKEKYDKFKSHTNPIWEKIFNQKKKVIFLNFPTLELAKHIDINYEDLKQQYFNAINCNYNLLRTRREELQDDIFSFASYRISMGSEELDLKLEKDKPAAFIGSDQIVILPSGFVEFPAHRNSLNGVFKADKAYYDGYIYDNINLNLENGVVRFVAFEAEKKGNYKLQNALMNSGKDCSLSLGFNKNISSYTNYFYYDRCREGTITLSFLATGGKRIALLNSKAILKKNKG